MLKFLRNIKVRVLKIWDNNMKTFIVSQYHIRFPFPLSKCYHTDTLDCLFSKPIKIFVDLTWCQSLKMFRLPFQQIKKKCVSV